MSPPCALCRRWWAFVDSQVIIIDRDKDCWIGVQQTAYDSQPQRTHKGDLIHDKEGITIALTIAAMPAYNEERSIAKMVLGCKKHVDQVVVVDDGSSDATAEIAEALGAYVVRHERNRGYGAALRSCFEAARDLGAERMVIIDSDGQQKDK